MFASKPWKEIALRAVLIGVILFNALAPTAVLAQSPTVTSDLVSPLESIEVGKRDEFVFIEDSYQQRFTHPTSSVREATRADESALLQTSTVLLQCDPSSSTQPAGTLICPNQNPNISLTETFDSAWGTSYFAGGDIRFRLLCQGGNCSPQNIYFRMIAHGTYSDQWNTTQTWRISLYNDAHFATVMTQGMQSGICGVGAHGTCDFVIEGYIPKEIISENSNDWVNQYVDFHSYLRAQLGWSYTRVQAEIQVSLDPNLLGLSLPSESVSCKTCPLGDATGWAADPINTRTGALSYSVNDLNIMTAAGPLSLKHTYVSSYINRFTSPLGYGWVHNQDMRLIFPLSIESQFVLFKDQSGNLYRFWYAKNSSTGLELFTPYAGTTASLTKNSGTPVTYTLTDSNQNTYNFNQDGRIISLLNTVDQGLNYIYDNGKLGRISVVGGAQYFDFTYTPLGQLDTVTDHMSRSVSFGYDPVTGDLTSFTDALGYTWHYEYENHLLTSIKDTDLQLVERNEYYADGKAWKQYNGEDKLIAELTYNPDGTTTVTDALENGVTHTYDSRGTLTGDTNYFGETQKTFDSNFRTDSIQSPVGDAKGYDPTLLDWSDDGTNLEYIKDPLGGETFIEYGNSNNTHVPTRITDPTRFETKYYYNDTNFPDLPTRIEPQLSYDNGVTFIGTDYEYYPPSSGIFAGKVKLITDTLTHKTFYEYEITPTGHRERVTVAYQTSNAQTTVYDYDELGRLVQITDPAGIVARNDYDDAGRLTKTTRNVHPSISTQNYQGKYNVITEYRYDSRSNQIAVIDTYGIITRTYYDLADRPVTVVQNLVGQTIETTTPPARNIGLTDENIRMDTEYDDVGNVIATIDPAGIRTQTNYDEANRPSLTIQNFTGAGTYDPAYPDQNIRTEYFYDANGNLIATKDTLGIYTRTYYDALNRPVTVVQNLVGQSYLVDTPPARGSDSNIRMDTVYDSNGNAIATVDPNGITTRTYYDALNRPEMVVQNSSGSARPDRSMGQCGSETNVCTETFYDEVGNVIATVDPRGVITETEYDEANRPFRITQNPGGQPGEVTQTSIGYDQYGRKDTSTDILGHVTKYEYNEVGQLVKVTVNYVNGGVPQDERHNIVTQYEYDALGRRIKTIDAMNRVTVTAYDDLGRVSNVTQNYLAGYSQNHADNGDWFNIKTTYSYDERGNQLTVTDTKGIVTRTYYDALGRSTIVVRNLTGSINDPIAPVRTNPPSSTANLRTDTEYLGNGNVDYVLDEMGEKTDYGYNTLGRLTTTLDPLLNPTSFEYDANGNRTLMTDAEGVATKYEYDLLNRLKAVVENYTVPTTPDVETNVRTEYTYDANGNRLSIRDGQSFLDEVDYRTTFTYDNLGRIKTETDPLGNETLYTYSQDTIGNIVSIRDAMLSTTVYHYDELDRLFEIDYPSSDPDVTFTYDALGRRTFMTDGLGTTRWIYNNIDQPITITDPFSAQVSYEYDEVGNRDKLTYADGHVVNYVYNNINRLESVSTTGIGTTGYEYDAVGRLKTIARPNDVNTSYNYYDNGWLQDIFHTAGAETLASYQYQYYDDGNRSQAIENVTLPTVQTEYTLTVNVVGNGTVTRDNNGPYHLNDVVTLTAVADPGWTFAGWSECAGTGPCAVTMSGNKTITATFVQTEYALTVNIVGNGTVTRSNNGPYHLNDVVTLTAVAGSSWTFASWSGDASGTTNPISITITGNLSVTAHFEEEAVPVDTGWISPAANVAVTGSAGDNNGFQTSPANAYSDDTLFAVDTNSGTNTNTSCSNGGKDRHVFYNYDLSSIPSGSTILGIEVRLDMKVDSTSGAPKSCIELSWDGGTTWTAAKTSAAFATTEATYLLGGAGDTWGRTWTKNQLNNLRVRITNVASDTSRDFSLDWIPLRVSYISSGLPADVIFADGFESGNLSRWWWADVNSDLSVTAQAAAVGNFGMQAVVNDAASLMVYDNSPVNQKHYSARFYFNPNSLDLPNNQGAYLFAGSDNINWVFCVYLKHVGESYLLNLCGNNDARYWFETDGIYINNAWTAVEIEWQAASAAGANNGYVKLWINDTLADSVQNIDSDTQYIKDIDLGLDGQPANTTGPIYFDAFESRTGAHIGLDPNGPALYPLPAPPDPIFADDFESNNLAAWDWAETNGGNLSTSTQAAAVGSYGMQALISGSGAAAMTEARVVNVLDASDAFFFNPESETSPNGLEYLLNSANPPLVVYDNTPKNEKQYQARFYFDPNSVDLPNGEGVYLSAGSDAHWVFCLYMERQGEYYRLSLCGTDDALTWLENRYVYINDEWTVIEIDWQAATAPGANDGYMKLFINDTLADAIENLDNDQRSITQVNLGMDGIPDGTSGTVYFDAFESRRYSHVGLDPNGPALQPPLVDWIFADGFETGDLSSWDWTETSNGSLSVSASAAMVGSSGMQAAITNTTSLYVEDWSPQSEREYHARFYLHPNSVSIPASQGFTILSSWGGGGTPLQVKLYNLGGVYKLRLETKNDAGSWIAGQYVTISNASQSVEVEFKAASAPGANDGSLKLWLNDTLMDTISGVDNDTRVVNGFDLGAMGIPSGASGTLYFDAFESRKGGHIGPLAYLAPKLAQGQPTLSASANGLFQPVAFHPMFNLPVMQSLQQGSTPVTIDYVYDPLNRLTEANYPNGDYYHYEYDAVGNRTKQTTFIGGLTSVTDYHYDHANRLTSVGDVTYIYDNNGNLKNDGVNEYEYDSANRLISFSNATTTATYRYNGLGDRLQETINGSTTTFTMDLNTGLTQALSDRTNTYIYGVGRIAQINTGTEYFLGDALGSVRQLTDGNGEITYARAYDPYGVVISTSGSSQTSYAFAGESFGDSTQLTYLRSRYYSSGTGRFLTRDTWSGDANSPMSYNKWNYVSGNPINSIDPTGMCEDVGDEACWALYSEVIRWRPDLANANMYVSIYEEGIPLHKASYQQLKFILDNQLWSICLFTPPTKAENSTLYTSCHAISWVNKHRAEIVSAAQRNGVPPELPAGILASEIDFDTDLTDIIMDTGFRSHTAEITLAELALIFSTHKPLGPGTANIHLATWLTAQNYFQYCGYLPSVITDASTPQSTILSIVKWVDAMETPSGAIEGSAVMSRFFADYRTGSGGQPNKTTHFNDLNTKDMALIFVAYRAGIGGLTCFTNGDAKGDYDCGYANVGVFQEETSLANRFNGQQSLPYFDFFRRYFEYFR